MYHTLKRATNWKYWLHNEWCTSFTLQWKESPVYSCIRCPSNVFTLQNKSRVVNRSNCYVLHYFDCQRVCLTPTSSQSSLLFELKSGVIDWTMYLETSLTSYILIWDALSGSIKTSRWRPFLSILHVPSLLQLNNVTAREDLFRIVDHDQISGKSDCFTASANQLTGGSREKIVLVMIIFLRMISLICLN